jgi:hypothetical protein
VLSEVGERIIGRFAACLAERLRERADETPEEPTAADEASEQPTAAGNKGRAEVTTPRPASQEPLDLLRTAGLPVAARAVAALAAVVAVAVSVLRMRRRNARKKNVGRGV